MPSSSLIAKGFHRSGRKQLKQDIFPKLEQVEDSFVVLNAARPAVRKRVDLTIRGFAVFARGKPENVKLCLHHAITEPETTELLDLVDQCGITDRIIYNPLSPEGGPLSEVDLARLYGACDVGLNTAMGEGWGLVSFEHASTGAAQIVPNHTACGALWDVETAAIVEPQNWHIPEFSPLQMGEVSAEGIAAALEKLYEDPEYFQRISLNGSDYANQAKFGWAIIADQFAEIFRSIIDGVEGE
jgi:glycosyltransferase involved in cell wall biosynthesis